MTEGHDAPAYIVLKQEGDSVTGTMGPNEKMQQKLQRGVREANKITVETRVGEPLLRLVMELDGDTLKGDVFEDDRRIARIELQRAK